MDTVIVVETGESVEIVHRGFDIVIIQFSDGTQKLVRPDEVGLTKRKRPKLWSQL
jgi:hypothetical protein